MYPPMNLNGYPDAPDPSHVLRFSDSSLYDYRCVNCDRTDSAMGGWHMLRPPCPKAKNGKRDS